MAGAKEIRTKIKSIKSTQKITKAMEMVAASKMRKAQERMRSARPYAAKIRNVISHLAHAHTEYQSPGLIERDLKKVGMIIVSTDRGLCGGLNTNLFKAAIASIQKWQERDVDINICTIGTKALQFFRRLKFEVVAHVSHLGDSPRVEDVLGPVKVMMDAFDKGHTDAVYLVYNEFINSMNQRPKVERLMPIISETQVAPVHRWDYIYEPNPKDLIEFLLRRYGESVVYQSLVENVASEMAARMVAMKSASDNAGTFIDELQLIYNKARQASITQELAEIVGGAAAV
jgi:F-type H+-transporting ATPase subunit gamma